MVIWATPSFVQGGLYMPPKRKWRQPKNYTFFNKKEENVNEDLHNDMSDFLQYMAQLQKKN